MPRLPLAVGLAFYDDLTRDLSLEEWLSRGGARPRRADRAVDAGRRARRIDNGRGIADAPLVIGRPFAFTWPWPCGVTAIHIRVFDAAGRQTSANVVVSSIDANDGDCDGHTTVTSGGDDCDDNDPAVHPGATEIPRAST